jgi:hypothetical protein
MPIVWKKKFNPDIIFNNVKKSISVSSDEKVSFSGFEVFENIPIIISMLDFPDSAEHINHATLVWSALAKSKDKLNKQVFLVEINALLNTELSTKMNKYALITSISVNSKEMPSSIKVADATIEFLTANQLAKFQSHKDAIKAHKLSVPVTPENYSSVRVIVKDKSPASAAQQAIDHIDLFRGLIALYENISMQISFGGDVPDPINLVRCGSRHTIHTLDGKIASDGIWYEPNFKPTKIHSPNNPPLLIKRIKADLALIEKKPFRKEIISSLIRYARAFDEADPNAAFLKLWSALENLTTPGKADYDALIKRCSFMYSEWEYHSQVLQHLREYRNASVHSGIEKGDARINCFQLQRYFRRAIDFYKYDHKEFQSLQAANEFLDLPSEPAKLQGRLKFIRKAIRFVSPKKTLQ